MTVRVALHQDSSRGPLWPPLAPRVLPHGAAAGGVEPARTVVVGAGDTGLSCARHLHAQGVPVLVMDSREHPPALAALREHLPGVEVRAGGLDAALLAAASCIVLSPGVPREHPQLAAALARGVPVLGDIELFARAVLAPVIAVTGSNGKSTVTCMVRDMLVAAGMDARAGGNLGPPALDLLRDAPADAYVLELSSFQLESTSSLRPRAAALLNLSDDHLDRYPDMAAYGDAKARVFSGAQVAVVPPALVALAQRSGVPRLLCFSAETAPEAEQGAGAASVDYLVASHCGAPWLLTPQGPLMPVAELAVRGRHNLANALAAAALAGALGAPLVAMRAALAAFRGLAHRCELVAQHGGVRWINDSKGTNVGATAAAVQGLADDGPLLLIAGGQGKGADFRALRTALAGRVRVVLLFGEDAPLLARELDGICAVERVADLDAAVRRAQRLAVSGDTVLLSPACASLDMYASYVARGEHFRRCVTEVLAS